MMRGGRLVGGCCGPVHDNWRAFGSADAQFAGRRGSHHQLAVGLQRALKNKFEKIRHFGSKVVVRVRLDLIVVWDLWDLLGPGRWCWGSSGPKVRRASLGFCQSGLMVGAGLGWVGNSYGHPEHTLMFWLSLGLRGTLRVATEIGSLFEHFIAQDQDYGKQSCSQGCSNAGLRVREALTISEHEPHKSNTAAS